MLCRSAQQSQPTCALAVSTGATLAPPCRGRTAIAVVQWSFQGPYLTVGASR